jgi:hypothetical protein
MRKISKRLYATSAAVFDFNGRNILNRVGGSLRVLRLPPPS